MLVFLRLLLSSSPPHPPIVRLPMSRPPSFSTILAHNHTHTAILSTPPGPPRRPFAKSCPLYASPVTLSGSIQWRGRGTHLYPGPRLPMCLLQRGAFPIGHHYDDIEHH